jgi:hypothetical protein
MRWMWMALLLIFSATAAAGEMWRWVDERGIVHYSDRPHPGAERVDVAPAQSYAAPELPPPRPVAPDAPREPAVTYSRLSILSPQQGEMLWNIGGELTVQVGLEPQLGSGDLLQLYLDGKLVDEVPQGVGQFTIGEVFRGEHTLRASIVDDQGRELMSSAAIVFYVQQASLQNPNRPQRPGTGGG